MFAHLHAAARYAERVRIDAISLDCAEPRKAAALHQRYIVEGVEGIVIEAHRDLVSLRWSDRREISWGAIRQGASNGGTVPCE